MSDSSSIGSIAGTILGAGIGTLIAPGPGTVAGASIGSVFGGGIGKLFDKPDKPPKTIYDTSTAFSVLPSNASYLNNFAGTKETTVVNSHTINQKQESSPALEALANILPMIAQVAFPTDGQTSKT